MGSYTYFSYIYVGDKNIIPDDNEYRVFYGFDNAYFNIDDDDAFSDTITVKNVTASSFVNASTGFTIYNLTKNTYVTPTVSVKVMAYKPDNSIYVTSGAGSGLSYCYVGSDPGILKLKKYELGNSQYYLTLRYTLGINTTEILKTFTIKWVYYTVNVKLRTGVTKIVVTKNDGTTQTFTSDGSFAACLEDNISWTATLATNYICDDVGLYAANGSIQITGRCTIEPVAKCKLTVNRGSAKGGSFKIRYTIATTAMLTMLVATTDTSKVAYAVPNTTVSYTANAYDGYHFDNANSITTKSGNFTTSVVVNSSYTFPSTYINQYAINFTKNTGIASISGIKIGSTTIADKTATGSVGTGNYNQKVVWTANPSAGYDVNTGSGWTAKSGDQTLTGTGASFTIAPTATAYVHVGKTTTSFSASVSYRNQNNTASTLSLAASNVAYQKISVTTGTAITASLSAITGYHFDTANSTTSKSVGLTTSCAANGFYNISYTATINQYIIKFTKNTGVASITGITINGVAKNDCTSSNSNIGTGNYNQVVKWTANASSGYDLNTGSGWTAKSGNQTLSGTSADFTIAPTANAYVNISKTANITINGTYINASGNSATINVTTTPANSTKIYVTTGTNITITQTAATGYRFDNNNATTTKSKTFSNITAGGTYTTDSVTLKVYTITVIHGLGVDSVTAYGATRANNSTFTVTHGTSITWSTTWKSGYEVRSNGSSSGTTITGNYTINPIGRAYVTITKGSNMTAVITYTNEAGTSTTYNLTGTSVKLYVTTGTKITAAQTASTNYCFDGNNATTTKNKDVTTSCTAGGSYTLDSAALKKYTVTVKFGSNTASAKYGTSSTAINTAIANNGTITNVNHGTTIYVTFTANDYYHYSGSNTNWVKTHTKNATITGATTITGDNASIDTFVVTIKYGSNVGSAKYGLTSTTQTTAISNNGTVTVNSGQSVYVTFTASSNYHFSTSNSTTTEAKSETTIRANKTIQSSNASINTFGITVNYGSNTASAKYGTASGSVNTSVSNGATVTCNYNSSLYVTFTASTGYHYDSSNTTNTKQSSKTNITAAGSITGPNASIDSAVIKFTKNTGVKSITGITIAGTAKNDCTSSNTNIGTANYNQAVKWTANAEDNYVINSGSNWTASSGNMTIGNDCASEYTIAPTATRQYTLTITRNGTGVSTVKVGTSNPPSTTITFSSNSWTGKYNTGTVVYWSATAASGYTLNATSGNKTMSSNQSVSITATANS